MRDLEVIILELEEKARKYLDKAQHEIGISTAAGYATIAMTLNEIADSMRKSLENTNKE